MAKKLQFVGAVMCIGSLVSGPYIGFLMLGGLLLFIIGRIGGILS